MALQAGEHILNEHPRAAVWSFVWFLLLQWVLIDTLGLLAGIYFGWAFGYVWLLVTPWFEKALVWKPPKADPWLLKRALGWIVALAAPALAAVLIRILTDLLLSIG